MLSRDEILAKVDVQVVVKRGG